VSDRSGFHSQFEVEPYRRAMLMNGLDEIGRTLLEEPRIASFERRRAR
jgi:3-isopropylmalate/(R)-2-methylmalate dehydratase small subunit